MFIYLYRRILDSSLASNYQTRMVFQDMLLLADEQGIVDMTHDAFSRRTGAPLDVVKDAIKVLEAPDPGSKTPEFEGRRLLRIAEERDWGWRIVNYETYQKKAEDDAAVQEAQREKFNKTIFQKEYMRQQRNMMRSEEAPEFIDFWKEYPRKTAKIKAWQEWCRIAEPRPAIADVLRALKRACASEQWQRENGQYIPHPSTWLHQRRWEDQGIDRTKITTVSGDVPKKRAGAIDDHAGKRLVKGCWVDDRVPASAIDETSRETINASQQAWLMKHGSKKL